MSVARKNRARTAKCNGSRGVKVKEKMRTEEKGRGRMGNIARTREDEEAKHSARVAKARKVTEIFTLERSSVFLRPSRPVLSIFIIRSWRHPWNVQHAGRPHAAHDGGER